MKLKTRFCLIVSVVVLGAVSGTAVALPYITGAWQSDKVYLGNWGTEPRTAHAGTGFPGFNGTNSWNGSICQQYPGTTMPGSTFGNVEEDDMYGTIPNVSGQNTGGIGYTTTGKYTLTTYTNNHTSFLWRFQLGGDWTGFTGTATGPNDFMKVVNNSRHQIGIYKDANNLPHLRWAGSTTKLSDGTTDIGVLTKNVWHTIRYDIYDTAGFLWIDEGTAGEVYIESKTTKSDATSPYIQFGMPGGCFTKGVVISASMYTDYFAFGQANNIGPLIPEPATLILLGLAAPLVIRRRRHS